MITISEHTFNETLINKNGYVLDVGCINFLFSNEIKEYCDNIICVDPNINISNIPDNIIFENCALISGLEKEVDFYMYNDIHGYSLIKKENEWCKLLGNYKSKSMNLKSIMDKYNIKQFELIKFDIEGAEYDILNNIDWTISKQYSIEFHDFRFMNPYSPNNNEYYEKLFSTMLKYCDIIKHELTHHPGFPNGLGWNYWDSLFILKKKYWK